MINNKTLQDIGWHLQNSYTQLPSILYAKQDPTPVQNPNIVILNVELAETLGLNSKLLISPLGAEYLSGNKLPVDSIPIAQAYAGHQFGYFTMLGDGRAVLLGEQITPLEEIYDIQLKGAGRTPYSRNGDGRATLSSMLREYMISESMYALNISTTRSLAVVTTGEGIRREQQSNSAVLTRISKGHIRVGTFQFAVTKGQNNVEALINYTLDRYFPSLLNQENKYLKLLEEVIALQAKLISDWQLVGFIHGVMNTDNMSIVGETIDYGPCAFMDTYHRKTVFSSIDHGGRYAYGNQPLIAQWNLARFAETLLPLIHTEEKLAIKIAESTLDRFMDLYEGYWLDGMRRKLGLFNEEDEDKALIDELLKIMESEKLDYTNTFVTLMNKDYKSNHQSFNNWMTKWHKRLSRQSKKWHEVVNLMQTHNPALIPRNHLVEKVLIDATNGDFTSLKTYMTALKDPYNHSIKDLKYTLPPEASSLPYKTYCGT